MREKIWFKGGKAVKTQRVVTPRDITEQAILREVTRARKQGAKCIYFDALATDDDTTTLGDLVDTLR